MSLFGRAGHATVQLLAIRSELHFRQQGISAIILVLLIGLAATAHLVHALNQADIQTERDRRTAEALAEAKAALIGYAMTYDDIHQGEVFGYLPCPDTTASDNNGEGSELSCGRQGVSAIGRLPWKTLRVGPLKDAYGECLWYAVSGSYKNNPKNAGGPLSPTTRGQFHVLAADTGSDLTDPSDPAVAVIFSPGKPLKGQNHMVDGWAQNCGGSYSASNYLDTDSSTRISNAVVSTIDAGMTTFIAALDSDRTAARSDDQFNDRLLIITRRDIFATYCRKYASANLGSCHE